MMLIDSQGNLGACTSVLESRGVACYSAVLLLSGSCLENLLINQLQSFTPANKNNSYIYCHCFRVDRVFVKD
jgi:hypothetical protein